MPASYPKLLASGQDFLGRFDQFDLFAGEDDIVTDQGQAADGVAIAQFQVLTYDADGRLIPFVTTGDYATGSYTVGGQPVDGDTITVNGVVLTFRTAPTLADEILIGVDTTATAANIAARINLEHERFECSAVAAATVVTITADDIGTAGNSVTLVEGVTDAGFTRSGATLTGADAAEDIPSRNAIAIAAQAVPASTPGAWLPTFTGGIFNHQALLWPAGMVELAQRKMAFAGTSIGVRQLL